MNVTIGRALNLLNHGYSVMPIADGKKPLIKWKEYQSQKIQPDDLQKLESKTKGYGIICGFWNVECIDVDLKVFGNIHDGKKFWEEFTSFLSDHIDDFEDKFVIYKTLNSGYHIIYRCEKNEGNQSLAKLKGHSSSLIETRGIGGYIYIYDNLVSKNDYLGIKEISIEDRDLIVGLCRYFDYKDEPDQNVKNLSKNESGLTPWDDFNKRHDFFDAVGNDFQIVKQLSDRVIIKVTGSKTPHCGYVFKDTGLSYLFTTGTVYPHEKALSPFSCYSWKYFNGNFSEASKELYKQGYGERKVKKIEIEKPEIQKSELVFPIEIFPEEVQAYLIQNQVTLNHSIDYMGASLLWIISLCIGNSTRVEVKTGWRESCNIWIGLIGKAGLGKTPSINAVTFPIEKRNSFEIKHYQNEYRKWKEYEKLTKNERKDHEEIKEPIRRQFIVNDVTIEALADLHEENENGIAVFKDELNGWLKDMNKYKPGSDLEFWLSCWSNKPANLTRKTSKSSFIAMPLMPVLGGIQPGIFSQVSTEENKDNGFMDRLLVCYPEKEIEKYNRNSISQEVLEWWEAYLCQMFDKFRKDVLTFNKFGEIEPRIVRFDSGAEIEWERIYNNITDMQNSDDVNEYVKSMLAKQKIYVPRFALILNCLYAYAGTKDFDWIDSETMKNAEKLSNYFIGMSKKIKISMIESLGMKDFIRTMKGSPNELIVKSVSEWNPDFNRSELAELLNVSRKTIHKYLKK